MNKPGICAVIVNNDLTAAQAAEPLADLFEVRIDMIGEGWQELGRKLRKPWIATNRLAEEGGKWQGAEARRIESLLLAIEIGASFVDVELRTKNLENIVPMVKKRATCILSHHDYERTPPFEELKTIVERQWRAGADMCKVVTAARTFEDNLTVLKLVTVFSAHRILSFAMGQEGVISRVLSPLAGAEFTYASVERGMESAPGQITVSEMRRTYEIVTRPAPKQMT